MIRRIGVPVFVCLCLPAPAGAESREQVVAARSVHEECLDLEKGQALSYGFSSSIAVRFNVHYHEGDEVLYLDQQRGVSSFQGSVSVPQTGEFCMMWENRNYEDITLSYEFSAGDGGDF